MAINSTLNLTRSVASQIRSKILLTGTITVAEYMRIALTQTASSNNSSIIGASTNINKQQEGYYMKKDVFGQKGDFITSPEITQVFGEMLGVWGVQCWYQLKGPKQFNFVELGPGRGTLSNDMLRVFHRFEEIIGDKVSLNLVEISPHLSKIQMDTLCDVGMNNSQDVSSSSNAFQSGTARKYGFPVSWYKNLKDVPECFSFYVAHEFFDALPVHKFQKEDTGWREVLIDLADPNKDDFSFVISRHETPVLKVLKTRYPFVFETPRRHLEISLEALKILDELITRLEVHGGMALIVDYGHEGTKGDTFRAFRKHELHDPLINPGTADLTADVDFSILKQIFSDRAMICGPATQQTFLRRMGIELRQQSLIDAAKSDSEREQLESGYKMIMDDMGSRFHFLAVFPKVLEPYLPKLKIAGFYE